MERDDRLRPATRPRVLRDLAGPVRPVDAMAVADSAAAWYIVARSDCAGSEVVRPPRRQGVLHVLRTKFIAAGIIVALFGGFLIAGVFTHAAGRRDGPGGGDRVAHADDDRRLALGRGHRGGRARGLPSRQRWRARPRVSRLRLCRRRPGQEHLARKPHRPPLQAWGRGGPRLEARGRGPLPEGLRDRA